MSLKMTKVEHCLQSGGINLYYQCPNFEHRKFVSSSGISDRSCCK